MADLERNVIARFPKFDDLEVHVSEITFDGQTFIEVREYIPSLDRYGKGNTMSLELAKQVGEATKWAADDIIAAHEHG